MHVLIVYCHPEPASFNGALKDVAVETLQQIGHTVEVSDLYGEKFDPLEKSDHYIQRADPNWFSGMNEQRHASNTSSLPADVLGQISRLERADLVIFQFPLWWHAQPPAVLKGYFDRVFVAGRLYTSRMRYSDGYFKGKRAICSVTTGAPQETFEGNGRGGNMDIMMWPIHYSIYYMGFTVLPPFVSYGVQSLPDFERLEESLLNEHFSGLKNAWAQRLKKLDQTIPLVLPGWEDWDETGRPRKVE